MKIIYSPRFAKEYRKLPLKIKLQAEKKEEMFRKNPFATSLKTHKLTGKLHEFFSFSVNYHIRIVFHYQNDETIVFDNIGSHEVYR